MLLKFVSAVAAVVAVSLFAGHAAESQSRITKKERKPAEPVIWSYESAGAAIGPMPLTDLIEAVEDGEVTAKTQVYTPDDGWRAAAAVPELAEALE